MAASCRPRSSIELIASRRGRPALSRAFFIRNYKKNNDRENPMDTVDRRTILATGALALAGAAATSSAEAQAGPKAIFPLGITTIPIVGETDVFPVRRIYCIGRNYAAHAREMGSDPNREPPFFFQKPTDAIQNVSIGTVADHPYPLLTKNYHYEVELVPALKSRGSKIPSVQAPQPGFG